MMNRTVNVVITGAAGQIGYALLPRLLTGEIFGSEVRVNLRLVEVPAVVERLRGVVMELDDCAFRLAGDISVTDDIRSGAEGADWALLVGSVPRGIVYQGKKLEERSDLLKINGGIFVEQGKAIGQLASPNCRVLVVGNPANTNCMIGRRWAEAPDQLWMAMTALDANRSKAQLAQKAGCAIADIKRLCIWGNHSPTMYPDAHNATIGSQSAAERIADPQWLADTFIGTVQQRGKAVIEARGASSALSAANAALDTVRLVHGGTGADDCLSAAICSGGEYDIPEGLICGYPLQSGGGKLSIMEGFELDDEARRRIGLSVEELQQEKEAVQHLL